MSIGLIKLLEQGQICSPGGQTQANQQVEAFDLLVTHIWLHHLCRTLAMNHFYRLMLCFLTWIRRLAVATPCALWIERLAFWVW